MAREEKLVNLGNLDVIFPEAEQNLFAVHGLGFTLVQGETLALLGESGCGKSLTALSILRLLPNQAVYGDESTICVSGIELLDLPLQQMRHWRGKRIAMIFQEPMTALNPVLTIGQQLTQILKQDPSISKSERYKRMLDLLTEVEIPQPELRLKQYPHQFSGGQKQRILIAMALAHKPEILVADEPTTALDVTIQEQILQLLKKLQKTHNMTMLLITHDLSVVHAVADRVCVMYAGHVVEEARVDDFFREVKHPYAQQLLGCLPSFNLRPYQLNAISGQVPSLDAMPNGCRFHPRCNYSFTPCTSLPPDLLNIGSSKVRCHLYPQHQSLPNLATTQIAWAKAPEQLAHNESSASKAIAEPECSSNIILQVKNLTIDYAVARSWIRKSQILTAVKDVSFSLPCGKTLALVGESGSGKTSIARALLKLLPITTGSIEFADLCVNDLSHAKLRDYRRRVQMIFQDPFSSMNPRWSVGEIITEGLHAAGKSSKYCASKLLDLLEKVGLPKSSMKRYPHEFSGGQRQRIAIARALATDPEMIICDEPTSALDMSVQAHILNLLRQLQNDLKISYLLITHNMNVVAYLADFVSVLHQGEIVEYGAIESIWHNPKTTYTKALMSAQRNG